MEAPKTKQFISILNNIKANSRKVLFVLPENSNNIYLSSRNLENVKVITANQINTYDIMCAYSVVFVDGTQDVLKAEYGR
jgi:Ribosomal protein L4